MTRTTPGPGRPDQAPVQDPDDWTDAGTFQRAEEARVNRADGEAAALPDHLGSLSVEADEADVIEQHRDLGDADEDDEPRDLSPEWEAE